MAGVTKLAFSVDEFCQSYGLGKTSFYARLKDGSGPVLMRVGHRTLISREAAENWRRRMEQGASTKVAAA